MSGYLYIIKYSDFHKIGITNDLNDRLSKIQTGFPSRIEVERCFSFDSPESVEKKIHARFDVKRASGEWFSLEAEDIYQICKMCKELGGIEVKVNIHNKKLDRSGFKSEQEKKQDDLDTLEFILDRMVERGFCIRALVGYDDSVILVVEGASLNIPESGGNPHFSVGKTPDVRPEIAFVYNQTGQFWKIIVGSVREVARSEMAKLRRIRDAIMS